MDFTQALLLSGVVFALAYAVHRAVPTLQGWAMQLVVLALGVGLTFLIAYSDYGETQIVNGIKLSDANWPSLLVIGLVLGAGGTVLDRVYKSVSNIGQNSNDPGPPIINTVPLDTPPPEGFQEAIDAASVSSS